MIHTNKKNVQTYYNGHKSPGHFFNGHGWCDALCGCIMEQRVKVQLTEEEGGGEEGRVIYRDR